MARACMLAALALVCAAQSACAANLNIPSWAYGMLPRGSGQDPAVVTELPPGCASGTNSNCANTYFSRWLACSTLSVWCTPSEVYSKCTFEPKGTWFRGFPGYPGLGVINAPNSWPYCLPELEAIYAKCPGATRQADACNIWQIAKDQKITLSPRLGNSHEATAALGPWNPKA